MSYLEVQIGKGCVSTEQKDPRRLPEESFEYIDISSIDKDSKQIVSTTKIVGKDAPSRARKLVREGDVLVSTVRPNLNAVAIVPSELDGEIASTGFCVLRAKRNVLDERYLFYRTITAEFVNFLVANMRGANYPAVTDGVVKENLIPLPPPKEQRRIVEILDQADELRQKRAEADQKAERILPALFIKMFGDPATNPMGWETTTIGEIIEEPQFGYSTALSNKTEKKDGMLPVLRIANISNNGYLLTDDLRFDKVTERKQNELLLKRGDLLFNWRNSPNLVGKTAIFDVEGDYIFASFLFRLKVIEEKATNRFVWFYLNKLRKQGWFEMKCRQAVSQANFGREELCEIKIPLPSYERQQKFSERVEELENLRQNALKCKNELDNLFKLLLQRAFSGELTAQWREAHLKELLEEMEIQRRELDLSDSKAAKLF